MENIENVDEVMLRYFKANIGLEDLINELANGDWSRFDAFFKLPNYDPDNWLKRKFTLKGIFILPSILKNVPQSIVQGYNESYSCFIYGNYLATAAMARSVLGA